MSESTLLAEHGAKTTLAPVWTGGLGRVRRLFHDSTARSACLALFDQALFSGTNFLTIVIIGRACLPAELGVYQLVLSIVLIAYLVQDAVIGAPYRIYCHQRHGKRLASYSGSALIHQAALAALTMACLVGLLIAIRLGVGPVSMESALWVLLPAAPFVLLREFIRRISFARLQTLTAIAVDGCVAMLQLGGLCLLAWQDALSIRAVYAVIGASCGVATLGWFALRELPLRPRKTRILADWKHNWSFSKWTLGSLLVANSTAIIALPWFLAGAHGEAATGVLAACTALVGLANTFLVGVDNMLGPKTAHSYVSGGLPELKRLVARSTLLLSAVLSAFCLAVWMAGDSLSLTVYGSQYAGTGTILLLFTLNVLAAALGMGPGNGLWALEKPSSNFAASLCDMTATVLVAVCVVRLWGVEGVALATLIGTSVGTSMRWLMFLRHLGALRVAPQQREGNSR